PEPRCSRPRGHPTSRRSQNPVAKIITQCSGHIPSDKSRQQEGITERSEKEILTPDPLLYRTRSSSA
ncbi:hypothetical protein, partial [Sinorhizobium meliloti]|uniref:hypothetical protein n=1 Tax=Rhizobium meliloti TaxID=382 RepID=UPI001AECFFFA